MKQAVRRDWDWSNRFVPAIKRLVGPHLLTPAALEQDAHEATDLIVLVARDMRIAARVRRQGYADSFPYEFTIRARRDSGAVTELEKIVNGWGDWFFYGHADNFDGFSLWWLIDLHSFRAALIRNSNNGTKLRFGDKPNGDGTFFKWFDLRSFPSTPPILIAGSRDLSESTTDEAFLPFNGVAQ